MVLAEMIPGSDAADLRGHLSVGGSALARGEGDVGPPRIAGRSTGADGVVVLPDPLRIVRRGSALFRGLIAL